MLLGFSIIISRNQHIILPIINLSFKFNEIVGVHGSVVNIDNVAGRGWTCQPLWAGFRTVSPGNRWRSASQHTSLHQCSIRHSSCQLKYQTVLPCGRYSSDPSRDRRTWSEWRISWSCVVDLFSMAWVGAGVNPLID